MFNQATRFSVDNFAKYHKLTPTEKEQLRELILKKTAKTNTPLFPQSQREHWRGIIEPKAKYIVKHSLAEHPSREILVLYDRVASVMQLWTMNNVLNAIEYVIAFTPRGNMLIGDCIALQRKGGNGQHIKIKKTNPKHPCNDIQIKLDICNFLDMHSDKMLAKYEI